MQPVEGPEGGAGAPARALWPWVLFSAGLAVALALYFIYPPA
jgi:hypothetical protein